MKSTSVSQLKEGNFGKITQFTNDLIASKLISMGVLPGSLIEVVKIAPFNGGYYLKVDGNNLAVRPNEAANIVVEV